MTQVCAATHKCVNEVMRWSGIVRMGRIGVMTAWELGNNTLNYLASADPKQIAATFIICTDGLEIQRYSQPPPRSHSHNPAFYADSHFSPSPAPRGYQAHSQKLLTATY